MSRGIMYMPEKKARERDMIIFGDYSIDKYGCGVRRFEDLSVKDVQLLIRLGYLDKNECQNDSPTTQEFLDFANQHPHTSWVFGGYVVSPQRDDTRVTIDMFGSYGLADLEDACDFFLSFRFADELSGGADSELRAWYD